ncbi:MAG: membrane protein insertase YidC [Sterolibacteriaceae bacterium]|uniref:Membrane protein insertase YidC n=1 Tax=Candidatus Methylophosphatis roskildensis TaxID=2899263 RepID=A0A9D7E6C5_9PROT|nr:membrane protein insertase YidC [Candidatus Methylophosphatis roskildensis]MBK7234998.1 membrane protein insertase YidC [Sterolibacteriaceae bacterium]
MDSQRLILVLILTFSLVMLWDGWQRQHLPAQSAAVPAEKNVTPTGVPTPTTSLSASSSAVPVVGPVAPAAALAKAIVATDLYIAEVSAQGGDIVRLELTRHKATSDMSKNFVLLESGGQHIYRAQSGLIGEGLPSHKTMFKLAPGSYSLAEGKDRVELRLEAPEAKGLSVSKVLTFHRGSYLIDVSYEIGNKGTEAIAPNAYFQLERDGTAPPSETRMVQTFTGVALYTEGEKYKKITFEDIAKDKAKFPPKANNGWIGIVQHYFVSAWLPQGSAEREFFVRKVSDNLYSAGVILPVANIAPGSTGTISAPLFAGPQEQGRLKSPDPSNPGFVATGFDLVVDYGWLTMIAAPLFWVLEWFHKLIGNWGWAIIALTVLIKAAFFPLSAASYKSMAKMRLVMPKLTRLKEQYGDDRAKLNQEMMELYKKEKINPLGGCLPIVVQIPVFISLYWVLLGSVEMRHAPWLGWIQDLSAKDPFFILPLVMGATMLIQTKLNPTPPDPIQAKVMMFMPIVFTGMFLFFPAGLVLYWVVNNLLSIAQQWQITRMIEGGKAKAV